MPDRERVLLMTVRRALKMIVAALETYLGIDATERGKDVSDT